jgi:predicted permease
VAAQVAASFVLLAGAGLLMRALQHAADIDTGFDPEGAYVTFMDLTTEGFTPETGSAFQNEILEYFSTQPWVESVAIAIDLPLDLSTHGSAVVPEGWESTSDRSYMSTRYNSVSPEYFSTLQIGLREGRVFEEGDRSGEEEVALVSQTFAERAWPGKSAVGRRMGMTGETVTVVGVVEDVPNQLLNETPMPLLYRPLAQAYGDETNLVIRSSADHALIAREAHNGLRTLDLRLSLSPVIELRQFNEIGILPQRVAGGIAVTLGIIALLLATMGVYGVMASAVAQRRREMGVRLALGAESGRLLLTLVAGALRFTLPGVLVGVLLALALGVVLQSLLLGISPRDPVALLGAALAVGTMVIAGTLIPARRAATTDPAEALRYD